jgi:hypothetical protein
VHSDTSDVTNLSNGDILKVLDPGLLFNERYFGEFDVTRGAVSASMGQVHFHALTRFADGKEDRISRIYDSNIGAWLISSSARCFTCRRTRVHHGSARLTTTCT